MSRYSLLYVQRGRPEADSRRARVRLAAGFSTILEQLPYGNHGIFHNMIRSRLGVHTQQSSQRLFENAEIQDVLDSITLANELIAEVCRKPHLAEKWIEFVSTVFAEENLSYRVGEDGIVHPYVDEEFDRNRASALAALSDAHWAAVKGDFETSFRHLRNGEGRQAIWMMFCALETASKVISAGRSTVFGPPEIKRHLLPLLERRYEGNAPALTAGKKIFDGLEQWIHASQPYRHGQAITEPVEPPESLVVAHVSAGATFLRWVIELHSGTNADGRETAS